MLKTKRQSKFNCVRHAASRQINLPSRVDTMILSHFEEWKVNEVSCRLLSLGWVPLRYAPLGTPIIVDESHDGKPFLEKLSLSGYLSELVPHFQWCYRCHVDDFWHL